MFNLQVLSMCFQDNIIWRYEYKRKHLLRLWEPKRFDVVRGYPKEIQEDFGVRLDRIDAAFTLKTKNKLYITKGQIKDATNTLYSQYAVN